ncbi:putative integral membrane protein [Desulfocapsa sulfexigens DSM 10523]|uniref:Putative integral membrane protein n=1 Tax=Desulfocapsa sulfexigens (strain DSM 10523 / SB164P1) TaxID=1167006 RepID=M1PB61_DESSD|nr:FlgO family outer membrane protein [Desulfocapsa sulfexigens]AGF78882.1 putative integral membrane protein [Desulfocapsa sulfexigens DSM 10523]
MKPLYQILLIVLLTPLLSSCSSLNCTRLETLLGADIDLINLGNKITDDLSSSAMPPLRPRHPEDAVLTSTFVDLDNLESTSQMGRLLQSHIGARLVQLGYTVKEVNLRNTMKITPADGETILSRDLSQITPEQPVQAILVGTYSINNRTLYITAKLIHPVSRNIISAQSYKLCMDDNLLAMFNLQRQTHNQDNNIDQPSESLIDKIFY